MTYDPNRPETRRSNSSMGWIIGVLVVLVVIVGAILMTTGNNGTGTATNDRSAPVTSGQGPTGGTGAGSGAGSSSGTSGSR